MRRPLTILALLLVGAGVLVAVFFPVYSRVRRPSRAGMYQQQRSAVAERVQAIGGWAALRMHCDRLLRDHPGEFYHFFGSGDTLPAPLAALRPQQVRVYPVYPAPGGPPRVVEIKFYGMHHTGSYNTPYYAVWVWGSGTPPGYTSSLRDYAGQSGLGPTGVTMKELAPGVYEVG